MCPTTGLVLLSLFFLIQVVYGFEDEKELSGSEEEELVTRIVTRIRKERASRSSGEEISQKNPELRAQRLNQMVLDLKEEDEQQRKEEEEELRAARLNQMVIDHKESLETSKEDEQQRKEEEEEEDRRKAEEQRGKEEEEDRRKEEEQRGKVEEGKQPPSPVEVPSVPIPKPKEELVTVPIPSPNEPKVRRATPVKPAAKSQTGAETDSSDGNASSSFILIGVGAFAGIAAAKGFSKREKGGAEEKSVDRFSDICKTEVCLKRSSTEIHRCTNYTAYSYESNETSAAFKI